MAPATCYRRGAIGLGAGLTGLVFIVFDVAVRGMDDQGGAWHHRRDCRGLGALLRRVCSVASRTKVVTERGRLMAPR